MITHRLDILTPLFLAVTTVMIPLYYSIFILPVSEQHYVFARCPNGTHEVQAAPVNRLFPMRDCHDVRMGFTEVRICEAFNGYTGSPYPHPQMQQPLPPQQQYPQQQPSLQLPSQQGQPLYNPNQVIACLNHVLVDRMVMVGITPNLLVLNSTKGVGPELNQTFVQNATTTLDSCIMPESNNPNNKTNVPTETQTYNNTSSSPGQCDQTLWNHVYNPARLQIVDQCKTVSGTIDSIKVEQDGDFHIRLRVDPQFVAMIDSANVNGQFGDLVLEPICQNPVTQPDAIASCENFHQSINIPPVGSHVTVTGSYVHDLEHGGWSEIHPVTSISIS